MEARINDIVKRCLLWVRECLIFVYIGVLVTLAWQGLELYILGEIVARDVDTVVALILTTSLYFNLKFYSQHKKKD